MAAFGINIAFLQFVYFLLMEIANLLELKWKKIMKTYNDISFVGYSNRYISDTIFVNNLKKDYTACLFDDRGRYEKTVMYVYRMDYRIVANYYLIFSSEGRLIEKYLN